MAIVICHRRLGVRPQDFSENETRRNLRNPEKPIEPLRIRRRQMQEIRPKINSITFAVFLLVFLLGCRTASADGAAQVKTDKDNYHAGETIKVNFFNAPGNSRDWICIVAAGSRDDDAGDYQYMPNGLGEGTLTFNAPAPGKYEVRAYYNYSRNGYAVAARYPFSVGITAPPATPPVAAAAAGIARPESGPEPAPAASKAVPSAEGAGGINVAVLYFTPQGIDAARYGVTVTNTLLNHPRFLSTFAVLGRKDLEIFLAGNNLQQNDQPDNMIEIGARLGLNFVIAGSVTKRGAKIITNYKVVGVAERNVIYTSQFTSSGEADLISNVMKMGDAIVENVLRAVR